MLSGTPAVVNSGPVVADMRGNVEERIIERLVTDARIDPVN